MKRTNRNSSPTTGKKQTKASPSGRRQRNEESPSKAKNSGFVSKGFKKFESRDEANKDNKILKPKSTPAQPIKKNRKDERLERAKLYSKKGRAEGKYQEAKAQERKLNTETEDQFGNKKTNYKKDFISKKKPEFGGKNKPEFERNIKSDKENTTEKKSSENSFAQYRKGGKKEAPKVELPKAISKERFGGSEEFKSSKSAPLLPPKPGFKTQRTTTHFAIPEQAAGSTVRLNKFVSNAGIAARRKADELIETGTIKVNGKVITKMGHRVNFDDVVTYNGKVLQSVRYVYILLNKPKDYITTVADEKGRHTVMELIQNATDQRVYPVGRLDRNTTGLLLLTNDGDLAQKLSHPSGAIQKIYAVELNKNVSLAHMQLIAEGIELEDGIAAIDEIAYADPVKKNSIGIILHVGKNRIVRRIFEHLGYDVTKLDRTLYAGLTKKDLPRGRWRFLTEREVIRLKHLNR